MDHKEKRRTFSLQPSPTDMVYVLEEDFSIRSLTSIISEDCFHDSRQKKPPNPNPDFDPESAFTQPEASDLTIL